MSRETTAIQLLALLHEQYLRKNCDVPACQPLADGRTIRQHVEEILARDEPTSLTYDWTASKKYGL